MKLFLIFVLYIIVINAYSFDREYQLDYFSIVSHDVDDKTSMSNALSSRIKLDWEKQNSQFSVHCQLSFFERTPSEFSFIEDNPYRINDVDANIFEDKVYQNIDRFLWSQRFEGWDAYVGRQAISLGVARFSSLIDVFYPNVIGALQTDYRQGVDAIKFEIPITIDDSGLTQVDGAWLGQSRFYSRLRTNQFETDWHLTHIQLDEQQASSLGIDGSSGDYGWWAEMSYMDLNLDRSIKFASLHLGIDTSIGDFLYQLELYQREDALIDAEQTALNIIGLLRYPNEKYGFISASYLAGSQSQFNAQLIANLKDPAEQWVFNYVRNMNDHWDISIQFSTHDDWYRHSISEFNQAPHILSVNVHGVY